MREFIKKDMLYTKAYHKFNLIISMVFIISAAANFGNNFFTVYGVLFLSMVSISIMSYDEAEQFVYYALSIPKGREKLVGSKYLSNFILCAGGIVLAVVIWDICFITEGTVDIKKLFMLISMLLFVSLTIPAFMLPFNFALGVKKGRTPGFLALGVIFGLVALIGIINDEIGLPGYAPLLIALVAFVLYAVSWHISLKIYKKKSF